MKFSFVVLSLIFLAACSATKPLTMDMSLDKGATFDYAITTTNNTGMSIMGQDMSTIGKSVQDYNFMVKAIQPTGITDVDFKITRMTIDLSVPMMGDMAYDSNKGESDASSPFSGLGGLIGKPIQASLNKQGKVTTIEGADMVMEEVLGKVKGGEQIKDMLDSYVGEESFKNALTALTGFSQGKVMKVGDTWTRKIDSKSGVTLNSTYKYSIREREAGKVTIDVTGESKSDPNAKAIEAQGMKISYNFAGPITGVIVVDEKTGWAVTSDIQQDLSGKMKIGGTPMGDMNLDAKMKIGVSAQRK